MDIRSAIDDHEKHFDNEMMYNESPQILRKRSRVQSTYVDNSEYKDIVHELVDWKRIISTIEKGNIT